MSNHPQTLSGTATLHTTDSTYEHDSNLNKIKAIFPRFDTPKHVKILDIGCGDGRLSSEVVKQGYSVTGLEIHPEAIIKAKQNGLAIIESNIEETWQIQDKSYDLVMLIEVLEHLGNLEMVLNEARRVLKPDGYLLVVIPNHFDIRNRLQMLFGGSFVHWSDWQYYQNDPWNYVHIKFLKVQEIINLLHKTGFSETKIQYNFMGGGIIPKRFTPSFFRKFITKTWPDLFSGKFGMLAQMSQNKTQLKPEIITFDHTLTGM